MRQVTGTHIAYLHLCLRKLWLFANGINMEHTSDLVAEGKLIGETAYTKRAHKWQELELDGIRIDYYDPKKGIVREVKKSTKREKAHIAQVKYYLWTLEQNEILANYAILEYPKVRVRQEVRLSEEDRILIPKWKAMIKRIVPAKVCPDVIQSTLCNRCAYLDFCYIEEF